MRIPLNVADLLVRHSEVLAKARAVRALLRQAVQVLKRGLHQQPACPCRSLQFLDLFVEVEQETARELMNLVEPALGLFTLLLRGDGLLLGTNALRFGRLTSGFGARTL